MDAAELLVEWFDLTSGLRVEQIQALVGSNQGNVRCDQGGFGDEGSVPVLFDFEWFAGRDAAPIFFLRQHDLFSFFGKRGNRIG